MAKRTSSPAAKGEYQRLMHTFSCPNCSADREEFANRSAASAIVSRIEKANATKATKAHKAAEKC